MSLSRAAGRLFSMPPRGGGDASTAQLQFGARSTLFALSPRCSVQPAPLPRVSPMSSLSSLAPGSASSTTAERDELAALARTSTAPAGASANEPLAGAVAGQSQLSILVARHAVAVAPRAASSDLAAVATRKAVSPWLAATDMPSASAVSGVACIVEKTLTAGGASARVASTEAEPGEPSRAAVTAPVNSFVPMGRGEFQALCASAGLSLREAPETAGPSTGETTRSHYRARLFSVDLSALQMSGGDDRLPCALTVGSRCARHHEGGHIFRFDGAAPALHALRGSTSPPRNPGSPDDAQVLDEQGLAVFALSDDLARPLLWTTVSPGADLQSAAGRGRSWNKGVFNEQGWSR